MQPSEGDRPPAPRRTRGGRVGAAARAHRPRAHRPPPRAPARGCRTAPPRGRRDDLAAPPATGDDAGQEALAKWLAKEAEKAGLPPELPVMAALVESGVKNLNFGDADSVGSSRCASSIWNQGPYAGYPENRSCRPSGSSTRRSRSSAAVAGSDADFGKDPAKWGEWIADVERPAEQYRGRYQLRLERRAAAAEDQSLAAADVDRPRDLRLPCQARRRMIGSSGWGRRGLAGSGVLRRRRLAGVCDV